MPTIDVFNPGSVGVEKSPPSLTLTPPSSIGPMGMPTIMGLDGVSAICDSYDYVGVALKKMDASRFRVGDKVYVNTVRQHFTLHSVTLQEIDLVQTAAVNKPGHTWVRDQISPSWWLQYRWDWDPIKGFDEWDGIAGGGYPIKTFAEFMRRMAHLNLPFPTLVTYSVNLLGDATDNDIIRTVGFRGTIVIQGTASVADGELISLADARNPSSNVANNITIPGIDWTQHVGRLVRTKGSSSTYAAIEANLGSSKCRLSDRLLNGIAPSDAGFIAGENMEVLTMTKIPGVDVIGAGKTQINVINCRIQNDTTISQIQTDSYDANLVLTGCELRGGVSGTDSITFPTGTIRGCSFVGKSWTLFGPVGHLATSYINCPLIAVLGTGKQDRMHWQSCGGTNTAVIVGDKSTLRLASDYHCYDLSAGKSAISFKPGAGAYFAAYYYGSGNSLSSSALSMPFDNRVIIGNGFLKMDAGLAVYVDGDNGDPPVPVGGTSVPIASLPLALTARFNGVALS